MLKHAVIALSGALGFAIMAVVNFHAMDFEKNHQTLLTKLSFLRQTEISLEKNVLRARNFWTQNYDSIADSSEALREACLATPQDFAEEPVLQKAALRYCAYVDSKLDLVEVFKSRNAVTRNSLLYIQKNALEKQAPAKTAILETAMAFYLAPSSNAEKELRNHLKHSHLDDDIVQHASLLLANKPVLDDLVKQIVPENENTEYILMHDAYTAEYNRHQQALALYFNILVGSSVFFLALILHAIFKIWDLSRIIRDANLNLEQRVLERTAELQKSQEIILEQQQALISSAKMSALGEMAGGVAHEINNPLAVIAMRTEQLEEYFQDEHIDREQVLLFLGAIKKTTDRIAKIVSGLKFFSRDPGKSPSAPASVSSILDETIELCREKFSNNGITLTLHPVPENLIIDCRAVEISQVVLNLLNNSYDAVQRLDQKWIELAVTEDENGIQIQVTDSGTGIPTDIQDKVMQPFFTTKEVGKGTGLGLSISRGIVQSHGGKFYLDTNCPHTRFCMTLPKSRVITDSEKNVA